MSADWMFLALVAAVYAAVAAWGAWAEHQGNVERALAGHTALRMRMSRLTGRMQDRHTAVVPAGAARGWVWMVWTRRARQPFREELGWAPTQRLARRALARHLQQHP